MTTIQRHTENQKMMPSAIPLSNRRSDLILWVTGFLTTGLYLFLMVNDSVPLVGMAILALLWLIMWVLNGRLSLSTPIDPLILAFLSLVIISLLIYSSQETALPSVYAIILGIAVLYFLVNFIKSLERVRLAIFALIFLAIGISLLGLVGMDWSASRLSAFAGLGARFSSISAIFQQYVGRDLINANTIGGALTFHPPLLLALLWDRGAYQRAFLRKNPHAQRRITLYKLLLIFTLLLVMLTILVSSSTGSILGAGVGLLFLLIWKDHRFLWLVPVLILLALGLLYSQINGSLSEFFTLLLKKQHDSIISRLDVWRDTVYIIRDFPLTGVGLGNFGSVLKDFYNSNLFPQTATYYFHPHNTLLSVAVDLGIPALVLYVALLSGTFAMVLKTMKRVRSLVKYLLMGLLSGLLAHQVFGLTDAYVLGKKLGLIMWIFIGLVAAIYVNKHPLAGFSTSSEDSPAHIKPKMGWQNLGLWAKQLLIGIGLWVVISLIAVTIVNFNTYLSLVLALVGGVFLGVYLVKNTSMKRFDR